LGSEVHGDAAVVGFGAFGVSEAGAAGADTLPWGVSAGVRSGVARVCCAGGFFGARVALNAGAGGAGMQVGVVFNIRGDEALALGVFSACLAAAIFAADGRLRA